MEQVRHGGHDNGPTGKNGHHEDADPDDDCISVLESHFHENVIMGLSKRRIYPCPSVKRWAGKLQYFSKLP